MSTVILVQPNSYDVQGCEESPESSQEPENEPVNPHGSRPFDPDLNIPNDNVRKSLFPCCINCVWNVLKIYLIFFGRFSLSLKQSQKERQKHILQVRERIIELLYPVLMMKKTLIELLRLVQKSKLKK